MSIRFMLGVSSLDPGKQAGQKALQLAAEIGEAGAARAGLEVGDEIARRQAVPLGPSPEDLPRPALQAVPLHGPPHLAARGLTEAGCALFIAQTVEDEKGATLAPTLGVTAAVIIGLAKRLAAPETLARLLRGLRGLRALRVPRELWVACRQHGGVRPKGACDLCGGGEKEPCGRSWCSSARESRASSCGDDCWVETCASRISAFRSSLCGHRSHRGHRPLKAPGLAALLPSEPPIL